MKLMNRPFIALTGSIIVFLFCLHPVSAHPIADKDHDDTDHAVMLAAKDEAGSAESGGYHRELTGPSETKGVSSIETMGIVELGNEFPGMEGRQLRARVFTIEPDGVIAIHTHSQRPGYAYIISGRIVEHRNDTTGPIVRTPGQIAMERSGITHWWENTFDEPVKALVVDIFTPEQ